MKPNAETTAAMVEADIARQQRMKRKETWMRDFMSYAGALPDLAELALDSLTNGIDVSDMTQEERRALRHVEVRPLTLSDDERKQIIEAVVPACNYVADAEARRQQRLAELLAEFEASLAALGPTLWPIDSPDQMAGLWLLQFDSQTLADEARTAARRYIIARDFNEFDPGKADMLWKLQNGGAV